MNRKQLSMSQDDLSDKSNWIFFKVSKNTCSLPELAATSGGKLPLVVSVEDVQYHHTDWVRLSSNEVVFLSHLEQRQRVLATADDGTCYSFPIDYPLYFVLFKISSTGHTQSTKKASAEEPIYYETDSMRLSLKDLIANHSLPCCVALDDNEVSFYSVEDNSPLRFCRLKLSHVYSEKYFVGSEIRNGKLSHEIIYLPTFLRAKVRLVQGFSQKKDKKQSWKSFMTECISASATISSSNTTRPPVDISQLKAIDVTKVIKNPEKLATIEPNDCVRFTSSSIHVDHTYEELPIAKPTSPSTAVPFVSTFKIGKKFASVCERSKDDSDLCADYDDTRISSDMFGGFRSDSSLRQPVLEPVNAAAAASAYSFQRPVPPHPSIPTLDKLPPPPLLPKSGERRPPAPLTLPKSSAAPDLPRPPPPFAPLDGSLARYDGLVVAIASRARLGSGTLPRNSLDQDSGYSTNPDAPFSMESVEDIGSDYTSIKEAVVPQPPPPKSKEPKKLYASKTIPRSGHQMVGAAEIQASSQGRLRCNSPYELRPVPQPPSLIRPNTEQRQGVDVPAKPKPRSQSKSSPKVSTERLFEPGPRASFDESPRSGISPDPPPPLKPAQKASRVSDRTAPAAPRPKRDEATTGGGGGGGGGSDLSQRVCPPAPPIDATQSSGAGAEESSDLPSSGRRHVPRPKTATANQSKTLAKPRKRSPEVRPESPSPTRTAAISRPNAAHPTPSNSQSNCAKFDISAVTSTTDFQINLTSGLVAESTWSSADYESTRRGSETPEALASDYEPFCPKSPTTPQPAKPKPTPPLPKCPSTSRPREEDGPKAAGAIESASDIPKQLNGLTCSQLADCLRLLNMDAYVDGFLENQIDGKLLLELDETILTSDLKVSRLHARKLLVFAHQGWRP